MAKRNDEALRLDERTQVELPVLDQLRGLDWTVIDAKDPAAPKLPVRTSSADVVLEPILRERLSKLNDGFSCKARGACRSCNTRPAHG